jgi:hypothetical protein
VLSVIRNFSSPVLLVVSCGKKIKRYMDSQPHRERFNMEPCRSCEKNRLSHIETGAENCCKHKKQPPSVAVLWSHKNRPTNIKTKKTQTPIPRKKFDLV